jgi:hypothetical protein
MTALLLFFVVALAALGYGFALQRLLKLPVRSRLEQTTVLCGLGSGVLIVATELLGFAQALGTAPSIALTVPAALFGLYGLFTRLLPRSTQRSPKSLRVLVIGAVALCAAANLLGSLAPPSFIDALIYHLYAPREYLSAGGIVELPAIWQTYQPQAVEMLYLLGLSLGGPTHAALLHAGLGLLSAAAAGAIAFRLAGSRAAILAAGIFYCTAMIAWESTSCFVELGTTAFGSLSLYAILRASEERESRWLFVAALFGGLAASCKLTAVLWPVFGGALLVYLWWRRGAGLRHTAYDLVRFGAVALLVVLPWYIRAAVWTGNPFYPFFTGVFGNNDFNDSIWKIMHAYGTEHTLSDALLAPWRLVTHGALFERGEHLGALSVLLAPVIVWRARKLGERQALLLCCLIFFSVWALSAQIARYLVPLQPLTAALVADALCDLWDRRPLHKAAALSAAIPALAVGLLSTIVYNAQFAKVVLGVESERDYLARTAWYYPAYRYVTDDLPPDAKVLISEGPTFYLERPHVRLIQRHFLESPRALLERARAGSFTHIMTHDPLEERGLRTLTGEVTLRWRKEIALPASRTMGGTASTRTLALYEIQKVPQPR